MVGLVVDVADRMKGSYSEEFWMSCVTLSDSPSRLKFDSGRLYWRFDEQRTDFEAWGSVTAEKFEGRGNHVYMFHWNHY